MLKVVFFGDSICVGQFVSPHLTWVTRIAQKLDEEFGGDVWVNNASHSGDTTRLALERMAYDVLNHGLDVLLIQFGLNDCNYWVSDRGHPRVALAAFQENLREMIARARRCGAREILLVTNHPTLRTEPFEHLRWSIRSATSSITASSGAWRNRKPSVSLTSKPRGNPEWRRGGTSTPCCCRMASISLAQAMTCI